MDIKSSARKEGDIVIFTILDKQVNHSNAASLKEKIFLEIADGNNRIVLDLQNVNDMDSSGLGALLFGKRQADNAGGNMVLGAVTPTVQTMIRIAQLARVFEMQATVENAVASLNK